MFIFFYTFGLSDMLIKKTHTKTAMTFFDMNETVRTAIHYILMT